MSEVGVKYDDKKLDWSLLPFGATEEVIKVLQFGAAKYSAHNWKLVEDGERRYFNAAMRHLVAHRKGDANDDESGYSHLAHAACCIMFILQKELDANVNSSGEPIKHQNTVHYVKTEQNTIVRK